MSKRNVKIVSSKDEPGASRDEVRLPLNLGLNDGTYAPKACIDVMRRFDSRTSFRNYTTPLNDPLREVVAQVDGVSPHNVFLHCGSGPILKLGMHVLIRKRIMASPARMVRHALRQIAYPIITPSFTYSKVPKKAAEGGLRCEFIDVGPDDGFRVDVGQLAERLERGPGVVYIANPNNPTGNVMVTRDEMVPLIERFPQTTFWIDEAYVHYVDPDQHTYFSSLVPRYPNLLVGRTFSFAYGLAAARIGYLLAQPDFVAELEAKVTDYRLGTIQEELGLAALQDEEHLPFIRRVNDEAVQTLREGLDAIEGIETFPSTANFVFARFRDGRTGTDLADRLRRRKIRIKTLEPVLGMNYAPYFRVTTGTPAENRFILEQIAEVLAD